MYVGVYNPSDAPVTVDVVFEASPSQRWSRSLTVAANGRDAVAAQDVVTLGPTRFVNFGTKVTFPPGRVGVVSFALWHDPNYGKDRVVDLSPTFLCQTPIAP
jgi:hypothetical protein